MTVDEVLAELKKMGNESTKKVLMKHGAKEPFFGVKVQDLKKIVKKVKKDYELSLQLFETGNSDAMYLAGLIADEKKMKKKDLENWAKKAYWYMLSEYTVAWIAAESPFGTELALGWIDSDKENLSSAGWASLAAVAAYRKNEDIDLKLFEKLILRAEKDIKTAPNRTKYAINTFIISVGSYIAPLKEICEKTSEKIGKIQVEMGGTECKVPYAPDYIKKTVARGSLLKKKKTVRC